MMEEHNPTHTTDRHFLDQNQVQKKVELWQHDFQDGYVDETSVNLKRDGLQHDTINRPEETRNN
jgi:hypothetical protein